MLELARALYDEALRSPNLDTAEDLSRLIGLFE
jgi:hypothetical protein